MKLDLLATQRRRGGQGRDLRERTAELSCGVSQRRARQRPLSRLAPPFDSRFDEARLGEAMRQQLWLGRNAADDVIA